MLQTLAYFAKGLGCSFPILESLFVSLVGIGKFRNIEKLLLNSLKSKNMWLTEFIFIKHIPVYRWDHYIDYIINANNIPAFEFIKNHVDLYDILNVAACYGNIDTFTYIYERYYKSHHETASIMLGGAAGQDNLDIIKFLIERTNIEDPDLDWSGILIDSKNAEIFNYFMNLISSNPTIQKRFENNMDWYDHVIESIDMSKSDILKLVMPHYMKQGNVAEPVYNIIEYAINDKSNNLDVIIVLCEFDEHYLKNLKHYLCLSIPSKHKYFQYFIDELVKNNLMNRKTLFMGLEKCAMVDVLTSRDPTKFFIKQIAKSMGKYQKSDFPSNAQIVLDILKSKKSSERRSKIKKYIELLLKK